LTKNIENRSLISRNVHPFLSISSADDIEGDLTVGSLLAYIDPHEIENTLGI